MGQISENRLEAYMPIDDLVGKRSLPFADIRGYEVHATNGKKVGHVKDIYLDPNTLEPCFALLRYEKFLNFNTKRLLVGWQELYIGDGFVQTRRVEEQLREDDSEPMTGEITRELNTQSMPIVEEVIIVSQVETPTTYTPPTAELREFALGDMDEDEIDDVGESAMTTGRTGN